MNNELFSFFLKQTKRKHNCVLHVPVFFSVSRFLTCSTSGKDLTCLQSYQCYILLHTYLLNFFYSFNSCYMHHPHVHSGSQPKLCILQFITPAFALYKISLAHTITRCFSYKQVVTVPHVPPCLALTICSIVVWLTRYCMSSLGPK